MKYALALGLLIVVLAGCGGGSQPAEPTPAPAATSTPDPELFDQVHDLEALVCILAHVQKRYEHEVWELYRKRQLDPRQYRADYPCP